MSSKGFVGSGICGAVVGVDAAVGNMNGEDGAGDRMATEGVEGVVVLPTLNVVVVAVVKVVGWIVEGAVMTTTLFAACPRNIEAGVAELVVETT
jgi:hypothetical protein